MPKTLFVDFKTVKAAITMEQVLEHYGIRDRFKRSGDSLSGCCPVHMGTNPTQFLVSISPRTGSSAPAWALRSTTIRLGFLIVVLQLGPDPLSPKISMKSAECPAWALKRWPRTSARIAWNCSGVGICGFPRMIRFRVTMGWASNK